MAGDMPLYVYALHALAWCCTVAELQAQFCCSDLTQHSVPFAGIHYVIDVNYFPAYKEFPDVTKALSSVILSAHMSRQHQTDAQTNEQ